MLFAFCEIMHYPNPDLQPLLQGLSIACNGVQYQTNRNETLRNITLLPYRQFEAKLLNLTLPFNSAQDPSPTFRHSQCNFIAKE